MYLLFFLCLFTFLTFTNGLPQPSNKNDCNCQNGGECVKLPSGITACMYHSDLIDIKTLR